MTCVRRPRALRGRRPAARVGPAHTEQWPRGRVIRSQGARMAPGPSTTRAHLCGHAKAGRCCRAITAYRNGCTRAGPRQNMGAERHMGCVSVSRRRARTGEGRHRSSRERRWGADERTVRRCQSNASPLWGARACLLACTIASGFSNRTAPEGGYSILRSAAPPPLRGSVRCLDLGRAGSYNGSMATRMQGPHIRSVSDRLLAATRYYFTGRLL